MFQNTDQQDWKVNVFGKVRKLLEPYGNEKGAILINGWKTFQRGNLYIMGYNPGGDPGKFQTIVKSLSSPELLNNGYCGYNDEVWFKGYGRGCSPHQQRVKKLIAACNLNINEVFATNAIFKASQDIKRINWEKDFETCWPVHQYFLQTVRPKVILCLGKELPSRLNKKFNDRPSVKGYEDAEHKDSLCVWTYFRGTVPLGNDQKLTCTVIGINHPSRYEPCEFFPKYLKRLLSTDVEPQAATAV